MRVTTTITHDFDDQNSSAAAAAFAPRPVVSGRYHQLDIGGFTLKVGSVIVGYAYVDSVEIVGKLVEHWALLDSYVVPGAGRSPVSVTYEHRADWTSVSSFQHDIRKMVNDDHVHVRYIRVVCERTIDWPFVTGD